MERIDLSSPDPFIQATARADGALAHGLRHQTDYTAKRATVMREVAYTAPRGTRWDPLPPSPHRTSPKSHLLPTNRHRSVWAVDHLYYWLSTVLYACDWSESALTGMIWTHMALPPQDVARSSRVPLGSRML